MNILITGRPGAGKTTLIKELFCKIGKKGGGFYTEEIREGGQRRGFRVNTLDGKRGLLSSVDADSPYKIGRYKVDLKGFESIALPAIEDALRNYKVVMIDEIGPMELFSKNFKELTLKALDSPSHVIATIKLKGSRFIDKIKSRKDVTIYNLNSDNKEAILKEIMSKLS